MPDEVRVMELVEDTVSKGLVVSLFFVLVNADKLLFCVVQGVRLGALGILQATLGFVRWLWMRALSFTLRRRGTSGQ